MTNEMYEPTGDSRRNFMKKGALAATALAVGAGATATTGSVAAQEEEEGEVVIHTGDFYPGEEFLVLAEFETASRDNLLENLDPDEEEFDDPSDWDVYAIRIEVGGAGGRLGYLMVENDEIAASPGDMGTMDETASFRQPELNLLELDVTIEEDEVDDEPDDEVDDEVDDEPDDEVDDEPDDEVDDEDDGF